MVEIGKIMMTQTNISGAAKRDSCLGPGLLPTGRAPFPGFHFSIEELEEQATAFLRKSIHDKGIFGHGVDLEGKYKPFFANPKDEAPKHINPRTRRREYRSIGQWALSQHVHGSRPYFRVNVAEKRVDCWNPDGLHRLIAEIYHVDDRVLDDDEIFSFIEAMESDRPPLSPHQARRFAQGNMGKASLNGEDLLTRFRRFLVVHGGEPLIRRLLDRAISTRYRPIWEAEVTVDIDGEKGFVCAPAHAMELARRLNAEVFSPLGAATFTEPSRNQTGAYLHVRFLRTSSPEAFNALLGELLVRLREVQHDDLKAHVCKVGGKLATWAPNPAFDRAAFHEIWNEDEATMSRGENYLWRKFHAGLPMNRGKSPVDWSYLPIYEERVLEGIDLITLPLHSLGADADGGIARVARYAKFCRQPATPEAALRVLLGVPVPPVATSALPKSTHHSAPCAAVAVSSLADLLRIYGDNKDTHLLLDAFATEPVRFGAAARMALRRNKGDIDAATNETLYLVELGGATGEIGPATGPRTPERIEHVRRCIEHWSKSYEPAKACGGGGTATHFFFGQAGIDSIRQNINHMACRLTGRIPQTLIDEVETRHPHSKPLKHDLIGAAYYLLLHGIRTGNSGAVPRRYLMNKLKMLGYPIDRATHAALINLFTDLRAGLVAKQWHQRIDLDTGEVLTEYEWAPGECRMFALRPTAIIPAEWEQLELPYEQGRRRPEEGRQMGKPVPPVRDASSASSELIAVGKYPPLRIVCIESIGMHGYDEGEPGEHGEFLDEMNENELSSV